MLESRDIVPSMSKRKTGTTIVGVVCEDGVVLGADTRATEGDIICDTRCKKIHRLAPNIFCCGAGTAADAEHVTATVACVLERARMEHHLVQSSSNPSDGAIEPLSRVVAAHTLLKNRLYGSRGSCECALILGGVDSEGPALYQIHQHGSSDQTSFGSQGSGSMAALAVLESEWRQGLDLSAAKELVRDAIAAGIANDLGSGSSIDLMVIDSNGVAKYSRTPKKKKPLVSSNPLTQGHQQPPKLKRRSKGHAT